MRGILLSLVFAALVAATVPTAGTALGAVVAPTVSAAASSFAQDVPDKKIEVTVGGGGVRWYRSPVWIAIGAIAAVVVLLLVILAVRSGGGGTTVIRQ
jgi:Mn2+/Fe2+ NRAMP family transporter